MFVHRGHRVRVKHKLLQTMLLREAPCRRDERVEIDDAYLGGEKAGKRGRGSENKTAFVAAVQTNAQGKPLFMRCPEFRWVNTILGNLKTALIQKS